MMLPYIIFFKLRLTKYACPCCISDINKNNLKCDLVNFIRISQCCFTCQSCMYIARDSAESCVNNKQILTTMYYSITDFITHAYYPNRCSKTIT